MDNEPICYEMIQDILNLPEMWDATEQKLLFSKAERTYYELHSTAYMQEITLPAYFRFNHLLRALTPPELQDELFYLEDEGWIIDDPMLQEDSGNSVHHWCILYWDKHHPEWQLEPFTLDLLRDRFSLNMPDVVQQEFAARKLRPRRRRPGQTLLW